MWRDVRVAFGSVAATPIRAPRTEAVLEGAARDGRTPSTRRSRRCAASSPIDDVRSTADYRREVSGRILRRVLEDAT